MNKKEILHTALQSFFVVLFNMVFFMVGGTLHPASVWISYGFIHFSYIMILLTPLLIRKGNNAAIFGFSLYSISIAYFVVEFIVGLFFILIGSESYKAALIIQMIIANIYAVLLVADMIANENTADNTERREREAGYIKAAASRVQLLLDKGGDKKANREIEKVYDLLCSSPSRSVPTVNTLEREIVNKIEGLERTVQTQSGQGVVTITNELIALIEERNRIIKLNN